MISVNLVKGIIMSQSFVQMYTHIVFHTKNNVDLIREEIEKDLYSYLGGPKTVTLADLVEEIKKSSSKWIKQKVDCIKTSIGRMVMEGSL
jgi:fructose-1,6-bisphosphatase